MIILEQAIEYPILNQLERRDLEMVLQHLTEQRAVDGAIIMEQGQLNEMFHIVVSGVIDVYLENSLKVSVAKLEAGQFFGEMSILTGERANASLRAEGPVTLVSLSREGFELLMDQSAIFRNVIIQSMVKRISHSNERVVEENTRNFVVSQQMEQERQSKFGALVGSSPFMNELREHIACLAESVGHGAGLEVRHGAGNDAGNVARHSAGYGGGPGGHRDGRGSGPILIVGEQGVGKFHVACEIHYRSSVGHKPIVHVDASRYSEGEKQEGQWSLKLQAAKQSTLIIEHVDLLPADLVRYVLASADQTRIIMTASDKMKALQGCDVSDKRGDSNRLGGYFERLGGSGGIHVIEIVPLRERAEDIPELVYGILANAGVTHPREAIAEEAMRTLCAFPFVSGNVSELKQVVSNAYIHCEGKIIRNKHLRFGRVRKVGERARIGLALGSGSVRGASHVGVLKVLEEEGIPIDYVAGSSVGAFIGALYVGGQPISAFEKVLPTVKWRQLVNMTMPVQGLVDNKPMARFVEKYIGPVNFEDLPIPFAAVASDAVTGDAYIMNKGRVSHAICASTAIPGVMKPVKYNDRLLIDGGVVHPVPVSLVRSMGADIVIAVDLSTSFQVKKNSKTFISSIMNTIEIMSERILREEMQLADVVLNPQLGVNQMTFKASSEFIRVGSEVTREAMDTIRARMDESFIVG